MRRLSAIVTVCVTAIVFSSCQDLTGPNPVGPAYARGGQPGKPPPNSKIAYTLGEAGYGRDIYVMNADGSAKSNLTGDGRVRSAPAWSPGGKRIAFVRASEVDGSRDIYVMNANGARLTNLTNDPASDGAPTWSPDGRQLAFVRGGEIYLMNADGSGLTQLTYYGGGPPTWSPDGTKMAFARADTIYVMNANGSWQVPLASNQDPAVFSFGGPQWSPDGTRIAFVSLFDSPTPPLYCDAEIVVMNADGSDRHPVAGLGVCVSGFFAWSPDGMRIAYQEAVSDPYTEDVYEDQIYVVDVVLGGQTQLTVRAQNPHNCHPTWSADGTRIVFQSRPSSSQAWELFVMNADGSGPTNVSMTFLADEADPRWNPVR